MLTEDSAEARALLERALTILDEYGEPDAAYSTYEAIERLIGAPKTLEQWYMMTGRALPVSH